jgi:glycosyltransferase involved in cell wall biosynthesis
MSAPELSVCVCTRNAATRISRFLPELVVSLSASELDAELVIVEDGSTDATLDLARALASDAVIISHGQHRGLPAARNTAAQTASSDWILFLDDDAIITPQAMTSLWSKRERDTCIVPLVRGPGGDLQNSVTLRWRFLEPRFQFWQEPLPTVAFPVGTCFLIHKDAYWKADGFDERFFPTYFDDTAFGFQLGRRAIPIRMVSEAEVVHYQHGASPNVPGRVLHALFENRWVLCLTQLSGWRRVTVMILGLPRTAVDSIRRHSLGPIFGYLRACRRMNGLVHPQLVNASGGNR